MCATTFSHQPHELCGIENIHYSVFSTCSGLPSGGVRNLDSISIPAFTIPTEQISRRIDYMVPGPMIYLTVPFTLCVDMSRQGNQFSGIKNTMTEKC